MKKIMIKVDNNNVITSFMFMSCGNYPKLDSSYKTYNIEDKVNVRKIKTGETKLSDILK